MDMSELASKLLEWEQRKRELDALEDVIKAAVLDIGKTQTVGNVRATFTNGRTVYDYETAGKSANFSENVLSQFTRKVIDWKAVCEYAPSDVGEIPVKSKSDPSVSIKLLG